VVGASYCTNAYVATVPGSIPASSNTVESERWQCLLKCFKNKEKKTSNTAKKKETANTIACILPVFCTGCKCFLLRRQNRLPIFNSAYNRNQKGGIKLIRD
jgi:hypothetical protein